MRTTASFPAATGRASALSPGFLNAWFLLRCFRHPNLVFLFTGCLRASARHVIPSVDNLAHSNATRPAGRNLTVTALRPIRSAIRPVRAF